MSSRTKLFSFILLFLFSWLSLFLLGDSYLEYILIGGVSLFLLFFSKKIKWKEILNYKKTFFLWLLFLFFLGLTSFFSISFPLSLHAMTRYLFVTLVFWFFVLVDDSFINSQEIIRLLLLLCFVMIIMSVILQFFPRSANLLPGMNLLYATYGHNHLAAVLLLFLPLSWWFAGDNYKQSKQIAWWLVPILFTLSLLSSFGRLAIAVGLLQFIIICSYLFRDSFLRKDAKLRLIFKIIFSLFFLVFVTKIFFSLVSIINPNFICPTQRFEKQLCKSIEVESRPQYWHWAIEMAKDRPLFGFGPGTFGLVARKYSSNPHLFSSHAHNAFFDALAEMGWAGGGVWSVMMLSLLIGSWKNLNKKKWNWKLAAFMGVISIYFDASFDFDWSFIGILSTTMILLALIIKEKSSINIKTPKFTASLFKFIYVFGFSLLLLIASLYLVTDYLISAKKINQAFDIFPYFHWHRKIYEIYDELNDEDIEKLFSIYKFHSNMYDTWILKTKNKDQRLQIQEQWFEVDPWRAANQDIGSYYLDGGNLDKAEDWITKVNKLWNIIDVNGNYLINYNQKFNLSKQMLLLADKLYLSGEFEKAGFWYHESLWTNPWMLDNHKPIFLVSAVNEESEREISFFQQVSQIEDGKYLGKYQADYIYRFLGIIINLVQQDNLNSEELSIITKQVLNMGDWSKWFLKNKVAIIYLNRGNQQLKKGDSNKAKKSFANFINMRSVLLEFDSELSWLKEESAILELQIYTDELVKNEEYELAETLIEVLMIISNNDYWISTQAGNLAILRGDYDQAQVLYKQCLDNTYLYHKDCLNGLQSIKNGLPNPDRYWQVSKIIRGEAVWQDFVK